MNEETPLPYNVAARAELRCVLRTAQLMRPGRIRLPSARVGTRLHFADGTSGRVYRETVLGKGLAEVPCVLVVQFRLRLVRGWGHRLFEWESILNTPLFVGFPGFVSKLWLAHDQNDVYRGFYEWDGADRAKYYARSLWRVLALGCDPASIRYSVIPGVRRDAVLETPQLLDTVSPGESGAWWRLIRTE